MDSMRVPGAGAAGLFKWPPLRGVFSVSRSKGPDGRAGQQDVLVRARPDVFAPVPSGWGRRGASYVTLRAADEAILYDALIMAWRNTAPKTLLKLHSSL